MTDQGEPLTVRFEALGREVGNIEEWSIDAGYLVSTDAFSFTYVDANPLNLRGLEAQPVTLLVGDAPQLVGRIDVTERGNSATSVECEGRDYIADLVETNVDPYLAITEGMTLQKAVQLAASPCGIKLVLGDAAVTRNARTGRARGGSSPAAFLALSLQDLKPDGEQGLYEYLNRIVARHTVTIQPTLNRNELLLQGPNYDQESLYAVRRSRDGRTNRVKRGVARRDFSRFPTFTIVRGLNAGATAKENSPPNTSGLINSSTLTPETRAVSVQGRRKPSLSGPDADGKLYRLLSIHDRHAQTRDQINAAAFRAIWDRLKDTLTYRATLRGHRDPDTGAIYSIDTMIDVQDEVADVNEPMWIYRRTLKYTKSGGAETDIECWRKGVYLPGTG